MSEDVDLHLGRRLRARRRAIGWTQKDLGDALGMRFQQIQKYECGANRMSAACLWRIAKLLDVGIGYFYAGLAASDRTDSPDVYEDDRRAY